jgi:hypothetical protein
LLCCVEYAFGLRLSLAFSNPEMSLKDEVNRRD